jgi:hypothetical protein
MGYGAIIGYNPIIAPKPIYRGWVVKVVFGGIFGPYGVFSIGAK